MRRLILVAPFIVIACGSPDPQILTGRVEPGFPSAITKVDALHGTSIIASAIVASDGSFELAVPPSSRVRLRLAGAGTDTIVFPRTTGSVQTTFAIRAGGARFDLGAIRFIGSSSNTTFVFHTTDPTGECDDGVDSSGATCVDDEDDDHGTCEAEDDDATEADDDDATEADNDAQADDDDQGDAVAEHNFPADGCADDEGESDDD